VEALQKLDADALVRASLAVTGGGLAAVRAGLGPTIGPSLPDHPVDAVRAGSGAGVNAVLGCTTHEMVAFLGTPDLFAADEATVREMLRGTLGDDADLVYDGYRSAAAGDSPPSVFLLIASDEFMRIRHIRFTEALLEGGAPNTRMYLFDFRQPNADGVARAGHGADMPYCFDNLDRAPAADGPHAAPLVRAMSGALVALARRGDPNHDALPAWPRYSTAERATMVFDVESHVALDPMGEQRRIWDEHRLGPGRSDQG
jgi:para-nitrobenzyl esterase